MTHKHHKKNYMIFMLADSYFAVDGEFVQEVFINHKKTFVPGLSKIIYGVINLRSEVETVVDLHHIFGIESNIGIKDNQGSTNSSEDLLIVIDFYEDKTTLKVDKVIDFIDFDSSKIKNVTRDLRKEAKNIITGEIVYEDKIITLIDLSEIFNLLSAA